LNSELPKLKKFCNPKFACIVDRKSSENGLISSIQESARELTQWTHQYRVKFDDGTVHWLLGDAVPQRTDYQPHCDLQSANEFAIGKSSQKLQHAI